MSITDFLTPKNTQEVRPGLFVQAITKNPDKLTYRVINPMAWNGKIRTTEQLRTIFNFKSLFALLLIIFISYNYYMDTKMCREFQADPCVYLPQINNFCLERSQDHTMNFSLSHEEDNTVATTNTNTDSVSSNP